MPEKVKVHGGDAVGVVKETPWQSLAMASDRESSVGLSMTEERGSAEICSCRRFLREESVRTEVGLVAGFKIGSEEAVMPRSRFGRRMGHRSQYRISALMTP